MLVPRNRKIADAAAVIASVTAAAVLIGWVLGIDALKTVYGPITMKTNAALALLLSALALLCHGRAWRLLGVLFAVGSGAIGLATLSQHIVGWDLGIDQLLAVEAPGAVATASPNRMGPNASTSFTIAATSLLLLFRGTRKAVVRAQMLELIPAGFALLAIAGYLYGAEQLYGIARYTGIALNTAFGLLMLHVGILAARADIGPASSFFNDGPAGTLLRRTTIPVFAVPLALGYIVILGRGAEVIDQGLSVALLAVLVIVVFGTIIWRTARVIEASDDRRREAEQYRDLLLERERRARDEAERASRLKDHFLATLSHELRTPLNVMLGWTRILEGTGDVQGHARAARIVARNGQLLARLVEDLLDISRASSGQFELVRQPVDLNAAVRTQIDSIAPAAESKNIAVECALGTSAGTVHADPQRLQQVISNVLSNALKFTPAGGRIEVRTSGSEHGGRVTISDTGIGFDPSFARDLFEPFRQEDPSASREHGGLGLGLSIARHLVELHGGTLTGISPGPGRGATFELMIPYAIDELRPDTRIAAPARVLGGVRPY